MHICFLTQEYPKANLPHGGIGTFIQTISRELIKYGIHVSVVGANYLNSYEEENDQGVNVFRIPASHFKGLKWYINYRNINEKIREIHQKNPIDIVESTELGLAFIKMFSNVKYVIRLHGGHHFFAESENRGINWWKGFQEKRSFNKADKIIGVSQYVVDQTSKYINFENKKGGVILSPANLERFYPAKREKIIPGRIFFAGTICEKKGIRQLVQAMPLIKNAIPNAHLVIAGAEWYFPKSRIAYTDYLRTFIDDSVKDSIGFLGALPNDKIPTEIECSEVCCYPSHMEAMPLAWIEVMCMGKAFVASNLGPGKEIIMHEETGLLCNPLIVADIADKVIYMLANKEKALEMGRRARLFAIEKFSIANIVKQNIQFYKSLI